MKWLPGRLEGSGTLCFKAEHGDHIVRIWRDGSHTREEWCYAIDGGPVTIVRADCRAVKTVAARALLRRGARREKKDRLAIRVSSGVTDGVGASPSATKVKDRERDGAEVRAFAIERLTRPAMRGEREPEVVIAEDGTVRLASFEWASELTDMPDS